MTNMEQKEILRNLFATAMNSSSSTPAGWHPIEDEDLLLDWSLGELSRERHEQLVDHLAACPSCRREIAAMIHAGALILPEADVAASFQDAEPLAPQTSYPPAAAWRRRGMFALVTALAASLLLMLGYGLFDFGAGDEAELIAMAERDLRQGRAGDAFSRIEQYLSQPGDRSAQRQRQATAILESAGYELARSGLAQGNFGSVSDVEGRVGRGGGGSGRLLNLRIQAERGETVERSLARRMSLVADYDYELDGRQAIKSFAFPEITPTHRRIESDLRRAIEMYPDAVDLRLNYGQFLLEQNEFARAESVFAEAVGIEPGNALAHTGLGLAILQQDSDAAPARALGPFQAAVQLAPDDPIMNLNLAVCLMRLGRPSDAQPYFEKAGAHGEMR